ncbi:MAG: hypothetical protein ACOCVF_00080 [bacterium]
MKTKKLNHENVTTSDIICVYFKNCGRCGQITTSDRWVLKNEKSIRDHYRPICKNCGIWAELPIY